MVGSLVRILVRITNSSSFVTEAKSWIINPEEIQVSYDVVALYPSVPIQKATIIMLELLQDDFEDFRQRIIFTLPQVKSMIELCMEFLWNFKIYKLGDSGLIGLSLMVVMAEGFLQVIERNAIQIALSLSLPVSPLSHRRYVDDTHDRFNTREDSEEFLKILNSQEP